MSSVAVPALLTGAAVAALTLLPRAGEVRLGLLAPGLPPADRRASPAPAAVPAGAALALVVALWTGSWVALLLIAAGGLAAQLAWSRARTRRARAAERLRAGEACVALAGELRAGRAPSEALATAAVLALGPSRHALAAAAAASRLGGDVPAALLAGVGTGSAAPEVLRGLAACWQVCSRAGSGLAAAVDRLAEGVRCAQTQERAVEAALAGPRASAGLLALLPLAGIALAAALGARPGHVLLHTPLGVACLLGGCLLDGVGLWWTARLVDRAGRVR